MLRAGAPLRLPVRFPVDRSGAIRLEWH